MIKQNLSPFHQDVHKWITEKYKIKKWFLYEICRNKNCKIERLNEVTIFKDFLEEPSNHDKDWQLVQLIRKLNTNSIKGDGPKSSLFNQLMIYVKKYSIDPNYGHRKDHLQGTETTDLMEIIMPLDVRERMIAREVEIVG